MTSRCAPLDTDVISRLTATYRSQRKSVNTVLAIFCYLVAVTKCETLDCWHDHCHNPIRVKGKSHIMRYSESSFGAMSACVSPLQLTITATHHRQSNGHIRSFLLTSGPETREDQELHILSLLQIRFRKAHNFQIVKPIWSPFKLPRSFAPSFCSPWSKGPKSGAVETVIPVPIVLMSVIT